MKKKRNTTLLQIGKNLRHFRSESGMSQEQLALEAEIDRTYLSQIERGIANGETDLFVIVIPDGEKLNECSGMDANTEGTSVGMLRDMLAKKYHLYLYLFADDDQSVALTLISALLATEIGARHVVYVSDSIDRLGEIQILADHVGIELRSVKFN